MHLLAFMLRAICFADPEEEGGEFRFSPPYLLWGLHTHIEKRSGLSGLPLPEFSADLGAVLENSDGGPCSGSLDPPQAAVASAALDRQEEEPEEKMLKKSNCDFFLTHFLPRLV